MPPKYIFEDRNKTETNIFGIYLEEKYATLIKIKDLRSGKN